MHNRGEYKNKIVSKKVSIKAPSLNFMILLPFYFHILHNIFAYQVCSKSEDIRKFDCLRLLWQCSYFVYKYDGFSFILWIVTLCSFLCDILHFDS